MQTPHNTLVPQIPLNVLVPAAPDFCPILTLNVVLDVVPALIKYDIGTGWHLLPAANAKAHAAIAFAVES